VLDNYNIKINYGTSPYILSRYRKTQLLSMVGGKGIKINPRFNKIAYVCALWLDVEDYKIIKLFSYLPAILKEPVRIKKFIGGLRTIMGNSSNELPVVDPAFVIHESVTTSLNDPRVRLFHMYCFANYIGIIILNYEPESVVFLQRWMKTVAYYESVSIIKEFVPEHVKREYIEMYGQLLKSGMFTPKECCICLDDIKKDITLTICGHMFHTNCISQSDTCPICRQLLKIT